MKCGVDEDVMDADVIRDTLRWAAQEVAFLARQEKRDVSVVTLKIRFKGFETHTRSRTRTVPSQSAQDMFSCAWTLFEKEAWVGKPVRVIGLSVSGWVQGEVLRRDLFDSQVTDVHPKERCLNRTLDEIGNKFGRGTIQLGLNRRNK